MNQFNHSTSINSTSLLRNVAEDMGALYFISENSICIRLQELWPQLLQDLSDLGEVVLMSRNSAAVLDSTRLRLEFASLQGLNEAIDLNGEFTLFTEKWAYALAVEEKKYAGKLFSVQFFTAHNESSLKVILTRNANLEGFLELIGFYFHGEPLSKVKYSPTISPQVPSFERRQLLELWTSQIHLSLSNEIPGIPGFSRYEALKQLGPGWARQLSESFNSFVEFAWREQLPLHITLLNPGVVHECDLRIQSVQQCPCYLHAFGGQSNFHFKAPSGSSTWLVRTNFSDDSPISVEFYDEQGFLSCALNCADHASRKAIEAWNRLFFLKSC